MYLNLIFDSDSTSYILDISLDLKLIDMHKIKKLSQLNLVIVIYAAHVFKFDIRLRFYIIYLRYSTVMQIIAQYFFSYANHRIEK
jgi:hypothetical protein